MTIQRLNMLDELKRLARGKKLRSSCPEVVAHWALANVRTPPQTAENRAGLYVAWRRP